MVNVIGKYIPDIFTYGWYGQNNFNVSMTQFILQLSMFWDEKASTRSRGLKSCLWFLKLFLWWCIWSVRTVDITNPVFFSNDFFSHFLHLSLFLVEVSLLITSKMCFWCKSFPFDDGVGIVDPEANAGEWWLRSSVGDFEFRGDLLRGLEEQPKGSRLFFSKKKSPDHQTQKGWKGEFEPGFLAGVVGLLSSRQLYVLRGQDTQGWLFFNMESWLTQHVFMDLLGRNASETPEWLNGCVVFLRCFLFFSYMPISLYMMFVGDS